MTDWPYPLPADDGGARHLVPGLRLPSATLPATTGERLDLSTSRGFNVLFVYPWTGRPGFPNPPDWDAIPGAHGSTPEAERFRDLYPEFQRLGASIYGLSGQSPADQREFAERIGVRFPILSDEKLAFADELALPRFETGGVTYLKRLTLIVCDGAIERVFYPARPPKELPAEVLEALKRLRRGDAQAVTGGQAPENRCNDSISSASGSEAEASLGSSGDSPRGGD